MAGRLSAILGSAVFLVIAPGTMAGLVPWWISGWTMQTPFAGYGAVRGLGIACMALGLAVLLDSFARFAWQGFGTPAPPLPTRHLVVQGFYRRVRNPMYVAVVLLVAGQALLLGDWRLLLYGALFWLTCHLFVVLYEEPTLQRSFGAEFAAYRAAVPRWIPRVTPWCGERN